MITETVGGVIGDKGALSRRPAARATAPRRTYLADMHVALCFILAFALGQVPATHQARIAWVPNPRTTNGTWVSDAGRHLRPATVDSVNAVISALERESGAEVAVVVVDSLAGLSEQEFALAIHRSWGVGKRDRDNGVVLLCAPTERATPRSRASGGNR